MAKDYKSRAHPPRKQQKKQQKPGWIWFVAGLLVGVFVSGHEMILYSQHSACSSKRGIVSPFNGDSRAFP